MSHPVVDGRVKLLKIVTPGCYWIRCDACEGTTRVPPSMKRKPHPNEFFYPLQGEKVFARDEDGFFYRGTICGRRSVPFPGCWKYVVQLTDTFQVKDFDQQEVYPTYDEHNISCDAAHMVSLYHLLPKMPPVSYDKPVKGSNNDQFKDFENCVANWDKLVMQITDLESVEFSFVQSKVISGSIYGEISISSSAGRSASRYNLAEFLTSQKIAVQITYRFEEVIGALMTRPLIDCSTLLPTFNPLEGFVTSETETSPLEPPQPITKPGRLGYELTGFKVHKADAALHRRLWTCSSMNIILKNAPLDHETVIRYVSPDGDIVLGTVLNVDVKFSERVEYNLDKLLPRKPIINFLKDYEFSQAHIPASLFNRLPPEFDVPVDPSKRLFAYDYEAARQNFLAYGGLFLGTNLPSTDSPAAQELIGTYFEFLNVSTLHEWQKLCLPALFNKANLLVMGSQPMAKLTTSTIFALAHMTLAKERPPSILSRLKISISPFLIIFVSNSKRANKIACLCKKLTDFKVIVSNSLYISPKQEELAKNGCDVLITTPTNWIELVSRNVFDHHRLAHVVFDEFSQLLEHYSQGVAEVFDEIGLLNGRAQMIILSNGYSELMPGYLRKLESITICVLDALLSNIFYGLRPIVLFVKNDDWVNQLGKIIVGKRSRNRLLVCKNEQEARSIVERIRREQVVMVVHENLPAEDSLRIVNEWRGSPGMLLVCTDDILKQIDVKEVNFLISWMSSSLVELSGRFTALSGLPETKRKTASVYIFCDCENLEEVLLLNGISKNVKLVNGSLDEHLISAARINERSKNGPVCPSVFMFGKCADLPTCTHRHSFVPDDGAESFNTSYFLKVDIVKVHSAFRYSCRIHEVISNSPRTTSETVSSLVSNLEKIEAGVEESSENRPPRRLDIGEIVGAKIECDEHYLLRRVSVKCLPGDDGLYTLGVIDYEEHDVHLPLSKLFILPDEVVSLPKDLVDLYISGLIPVDLNSDWNNDTCAYVTNAMSIFFGESQFLAGKVELVAARSVLVDSLHCFVQEKQYVMESLDFQSYSSLKDLILQSSYCAENPHHLSSLSASLSESGLSPLASHEGRFGCRTDLPTIPVPAVVSYFHDPGRFWVQMKEESGKLACLEKLISSALDRSKQKLALVALHELCLVSSVDGEWNRAIITDIIRDQEKDGILVRIVFVDYGDARLVRPGELYNIPSEFGEVTFFAIESELVGIRPCMDQWEERVTLYFESLVRKEHHVMKDLQVTFCGITKSGVHHSDYNWRHRVVLADPSGPEDVTINFSIVRKGLAAFDPDSKHLIIAHKEKTNKVNGTSPSGTLVRPRPSSKKKLSSKRGS